MIFNDKYNEIIGLATEQDESLRRVLSIALSYLDDEMVRKCGIGVDFRDGYAYYKNVYQRDEDVIVKYGELVIKLKSIEYRVYIRDFDNYWLASLPMDDNLHSEHEDRQKYTIFNFQVLRYLDARLKSITEYNLNVCKVNNLDYVLKYTRTLEICGAETEKIKSIAILPLERMQAIADMAVNLDP